MRNLFQDIANRFRHTPKRRFAVVLLGERFHLSVDGKAGIYSFYATRWFEANSPEDAIKMAIDLSLRQINEYVIERSDKEKLILDKVVEIKKFPARSPGEAFIFFAEGATTDGDIQVRKI